MHNRFKERLKEVAAKEKAQELRSITDELFESQLALAAEIAAKGASGVKLTQNEHVFVKAMAIFLVEFMARGRGV